MVAFNWCVGDITTADRGNEHARMAMAEIKTPPFTKGKNSRKQIEDDWSRELSHVRINVEHVIGVLKQKYIILQSLLLYRCRAAEIGRFIVFCLMTVVNLMTMVSG